MNNIRFSTTMVSVLLKRSLAVTGLSLAAAIPAWAACSYTVTNNWGAGFTAEIKVTNNTSQTVNNWSVSWQESAATLSNAWNANVTGSNPYTAASVGWNGTLAPGASASFGFQANGVAGAPQVSGNLCGTVASSVSSHSSMPASSSSSSVATTSSAASSSSTAAALIIQEQHSGVCRVDGDPNESVNGGFTGSGYANTDNAQGTAIVWAVNASTSSRYTLTFRFANGGSANRPGTLLVNSGSGGNYSVDLPATGSWTNWQSTSVAVDLVQGNNVLQLTAQTADGLANIDYLSVAGAQATAGSCGTSSSAASSSSSSTGSGVILPQDGNPVHSRFNSFKTKWGSDKADIILSHQYTNGGWPKNQAYDSAGSGGNDLGTFDNGATYTEMTYLANVYRNTGATKYRDSVRKAMNYILSAQYSSGGWPQYYPLRGGYSDHVTFNDNAMARVLTVLHHAVHRTAPFDTDVITEDQRTRARTAITKGVDYILRSQWRQNGQLTVWCAQHGKDDYLPKAARAYELESLSGSESVEVIAFLMTQPQTAQIETAVKAGLAWYRSPNTYLANHAYDNSVEHKIVYREGSRMWYRFYDLYTNRGFFSDRDGGKYYDIMEISEERRNGYSWGGNYGSNLLNYAESVGY